ncbi:MAG: 7-cyano-7-deazaguanine synthase [Planctomycetota bacterium]|nr:MAG: 7-cyano-7-deazaguanine synthase [Planctomycetota bacterium]
MTALALLSGGLDSCVAAALRQAREHDLAAALFIDYGQRAVAPERVAARAVSAALGVPLHELALPAAAFANKSALLDGATALPSPDLETAAETQASAQAVWVPNRNGLLVNLAAALAEAEGHTAVVVGFNAEEAATFPDNGAPFFEALNACLALSTQIGVQVVAPCLELSKAELVRAGRAVGAPLDASWSCYGPGPEACLRCESCLRRARAER